MTGTNENKYSMYRLKQIQDTSCNNKFKTLFNFAESRLFNAKSEGAKVKFWTSLKAALLFFLDPNKDEDEDLDLKRYPHDLVL